ncbi:adenylate/guanylate cyclase domain-containing protein [Labrenzia suaedae]|uniref:Adenylate/guanylate cyclase domain-containing protein n=2 Tax=Roseibium litorale TaxID=2803841 RepID=A0ABR9CMB9_9HYPH|nr:adenylate/guanylate cyclase domain-containing protein [Roseibium litorale]
MIDMADIDAVEGWLVNQALMSARVPDMFGDLCIRLRETGVEIDRALLAWTTLHPLFDAETAFWKTGEAVQHARFEHAREGEEENEVWLSSPMRAVQLERLPRLRRYLEGANAEFDFPLCAELCAEGYTDYFVLVTNFQMPALQEMRGQTGIMISWATKQSGGFREDQIQAIEYIQPRLALAAKANLESEIARTIAETYLGRSAGTRVLNGQIRHGDGEKINAVIFYCDMRNSTRIAEALGPDPYLRWLNGYFSATAGAVMAEGGEVLDFIGDAVLAVFPIGETGLQGAVQHAIAAADKSLQNVERINTQPGKAASQPVLEIGIALSVGEVMFGNIGVPERMTFSVIGQTVHAAARIETLTKAVQKHTLMTGEIAQFVPERAEAAGDFELNGFEEPEPLFALRPAAKVK